MSPKPDVDTDPVQFATVRLPKHVVYRAFVFETVVLNLDTGKYHGLNPVAGRTLELLDRTGNLEETAVRLAAEYKRPKHEIEADLREFCSDLSKRGLIELIDEPG